MPFIGEPHDWRIEPARSTYRCRCCGARCRDPKEVAATCKELRALSGDGRRRQRNPVHHLPRAL